MYSDIIWKDAPMPESSPGTKLSTLFVNDTKDRSRLMIVEFPKNFSRPLTGHYPAYEELFIVEGTLAISGYNFKKNDYVLFPPNFTRSETECVEGCLAIVWWSHKPSWSKGVSGDPNENIISKVDNYLGNKFIEFLDNDEFYSFYLNNNTPVKKGPEGDFIGVDLESLSFVQGDDIKILDPSRYFLKQRSY